MEYSVSPRALLDDGLNDTTLHEMRVYNQIALVLRTKNAATGLAEYSCVGIVEGIQEREGVLVYNLSDCDNDLKRGVEMKAELVLDRCAS